MQIHSPSDVGIEPMRLKRLEDVFTSYVDEGKLAGAISAVMRRGKLVHLKAQGFSNVEDGVSMKEDTIFRIYSMTKPIVSVAAMILFERGYFQLTTPVSEFIPDVKHMQVFSAGTVDDYSTVKPEREMNMGDLLRHTSGLTYGFLASNVVDALYVKNDINFVSTFILGDSDAEAVIKRLTQLPLVYSPGSAWNYSISTDVLGYIIEKITGRSLWEFLYKEILEPLGMLDTTFFVAEEKLSRLAVLYGSHMAEYMVPDFKGMPNGKKIVALSDPENKSPSIMPKIQSGGGGLYSTISDYIKFLHMLMNMGRVEKTYILSPKTFELMTCNHLPIPMAEYLPKNLPINHKNHLSTITPGYGFGLGVAVRMDNIKAQNLGTVGEYYWGGAASTYFFVDPKEQLAYVHMTQLLPSSTYPLRLEVRRAIYQSLID